MSDQYTTTANIHREEIAIRAMEQADLAVVVALDALVFGGHATVGQWQTKWAVTLRQGYLVPLVNEDK